MSTDRIAVSIAFILAALAIFFFQAPDVLFGPGHMGWVSSHSLAIIRNATPDRWFLGFTCEFTGEGNYAYFDRYPVLFSGVMHLLLKPFESNFAEYISWARAYMNVIYVVQLILGYRIALMFTGDRYTALSVSLFTFMGLFFVFYKDMIHFDQPAVLGVMLLFYAIARYEIYGEKGLLWLSIVAVLFGRGYASNFLLLLWNLLYIGAHLLRRDFDLTSHLRSARFAVFLVAGLLSTSALTFNVWSEARITGEPWYETSIIHSAKSRLNPHFIPDMAKKSKDTPSTELLPFTLDQIERTGGGFVPYGVYPYQGKNSPAPNWLLIGAFLVALFGCLALSLFRTDLLRRLYRRKRLVALGLLAGFFWLYPLRNLAAFHNYTHMYNAVFYVLVFSFALYWFARRRCLAPAVLVAALTLFVVSHFNLHEARLRYNQPENDLNRDIDRIRGYLAQEDLERIFVAGGHRDLVEGSPYAACLYFSGFKLAEERSEASVVVSRDDPEGENLLPGLEHLHLYRVE